MRGAVVTERTLSRARAGDEDAFRLLIHCHEPEGGVAGVDISCVSWSPGGSARRAATVTPPTAQSDLECVVL
jgi:hypothetical protein